MELVIISGIGILALLFAELADGAHAADVGQTSGHGRSLSHGKERVRAASRADLVVAVTTTITRPAL